MDKQDVLFGLLQVAVCGAPFTDQLKSACTAEMLEEVYVLAKKHDLAHLVGQVVSKLDIPEKELLAQYKQACLRSVYRYVRLNHAYQQVCMTLENAEIPYIPLKGAVLREYYPEAWMRTSSDIDILVKVEDLDIAVDMLTKKLCYTAQAKGDHDVSLHSPEGVHLELHYDTIQERYETGNCRDVLAEIWKDAKPAKTGSYQKVLSDAMFYFYHMAHMAKHFEVGGCGIRTFLDIWVLQHRVSHDPATREALLREGGLWKFAHGAEQVAAWWFCGEQPNEITRQISDYILRAGLYGDNANRAAMGQAKMGGRMRYLLLRRVFMPYDFLKAEYPTLLKHKWLTPFFQVVRWCKCLFCGSIRRTIGELHANAKLSQKEQQNAEIILKHLGLN